jgi:hypothetical protein
MTITTSNKKRDGARAENDYTQVIVIKPKYEAKITPAKAPKYVAVLVEASAREITIADIPAISRL